MRAPKWLKRLLSDERANVLAIGAATMPLLLGSAAFAVDTIQLSVWKRQLQRAADSAAIAGAYAIAQNQDGPAAVHNDLDENSFPTLDQPEEVQVGARAGYNRAVYVSLSSERSLPFMSLFTSSPSNIRAEATAALVASGEFCMVSLYEGSESAGIAAGGNANVTLGCGMKTNSQAPSAVTATGSSSITASPISAVGGIDGAANNFVGDDTTLIPYAAQQSDPLGHLGNPPDQGDDCVDLVVQSGQSVPWNPDMGCIGNLTVHGTFELSPSVNNPTTNTAVYVTGDIHINAQAHLTGDGVTIVMTGDGGAAGDLQINGGATLELTSPDVGEYPGVVWYRDRRADPIDITINGNADSLLSGALYFPTSNLTFSGNSGMDVTCLQMVGLILSFQGDANITNDCPDDGAAQAFAQNVVRLVG